GSRAMKRGSHGEPSNADGRPKGLHYSRMCSAGLQACLLGGVALALSVQSARAQSVTYARDVAPLLADRCGMCHHPGGSAPFSLLTYADAKRHAAQIAAVTASR